MKHLFALWLFLTTLELGLHAQHAPHPFCGTDSVNNARIQEMPWLQQVQDQLDEHVARFIASRKNARLDEEPILTIPIVFHIYHDYGPENISDAQVYDAVRIINEDFRKRNADTSQTVAVFRPIAADSRIEFCLPSIGPDLQPTNGINRYRSTVTYNGSDDAKLYQWPRDRYLNIHVTSLIGAEQVAGYAYRPASVPGLGANIDGIIILSQYIGSIGTGDPRRGRALTHEIGHVFNLAHPWGNTNQPGVACGDDGIEDTPETRGTLSCILNLSQCNPPIIENVQNFMDYSYCYTMFTAGQVAAMRATLFSDVADRSKLWSESNLRFTGTDVCTNENTALPVADFHTNRRTACVGENVIFRDFSYRGPITQWAWEFEDANIASSNDQNPVVSFNSPGWKRVSLTVSNLLGDDTKTIDQYFYVNPSFSRDFTEGFENGDLSSSGLLIENPDGNESRWSLTNIGRFSGEHSIMLNAFDVNRYDRDAFITPVYSLADLNNSSFSFRYSYATRGNSRGNLSEKLEVFASTNCGQNWSRVAILDSIRLATAGNSEGFFVPRSENDWRLVEVPLSNVITQQGAAMFRFEFTSSRQANNLYIDNINIDEQYNSISTRNRPETTLKVYPNPSNGSFSVVLRHDVQETATLRLMDITGKVVFSQWIDLHLGYNELPLKVDLPSGIYHLQVQTSREWLHKKVQISGRF